MSDINSVLVSLEENLKRMSSAREQINLISGKTEILVEEYKENGVYLKELTTKFGVVGSEFENTVNNQLLLLKDSVAKINRECSDSAHLVKKQVEQILPEFNNSFENIKESIVIITQEAEQKRKETIEAFLSDNKEIYKSAKETINSFTEQTSSELTNFSLKLNEKTEEIKQLEFKKEIIELNKTQSLLSNTFIELSKRVDRIVDDCNDIEVQIKQVTSILEQQKESFIKIEKMVNVASDKNLEALQGLKKPNLLLLIVLVVLTLINIGLVFFK